MAWRSKPRALLSAHWPRSEHVFRADDEKTALKKVTSDYSAYFCADWIPILLQKVSSNSHDCIISVLMKYFPSQMHRCSYFTIHRIPNISISVSLGEAQRAAS